jgi:hypothetical protein
MFEDTASCCPLTHTIMHVIVWVTEVVGMEQIIKQPDGRYAVFSSVTGTLLVWDGAEDEIVEWITERAAERAREGARKTIALVAAGDEMKIYGRHGLSWGEALESDQRHNGEASGELTAHG